jgi:hypothetical protein
MAKKNPCKQPILPYCVAGDFNAAVLHCKAASPYRTLLHFSWAIPHSIAKKREKTVL